MRLKRILIISIALISLTAMTIPTLAASESTSTSVEIIGIIEPKKESNSSGGGNHGGGGGGNGGGGNHGGSSRDPIIIVDKGKPTENITEPIYDKEDPYTGNGGLELIEEKNIGAVVNLNTYVFSSENSISSSDLIAYNIGDVNIKSSIIDLTPFNSNAVIPSDLLNLNIETKRDYVSAYKLCSNNPKEKYDKPEKFMITYKIEEID